MAVVRVEPSNSPPVRLNGVTWIRVGPRRARATVEEENALQNADVLGVFLSTSNKSLLPLLMTWILNYLSMNTFLMQLPRQSYLKIVVQLKINSKHCDFCQKGKWLQ
jgi:hypothetical protein